MKYLVNMLIINFLMLTAAEVPAEEVPAEKSNASVGSVDSASSFSRDAAGRPMATTVEQVTPHLYYGKRQDDRDLAFGMARLTRETLPLWEKFLFGQYEESARALYDLVPAKEPPAMEAYALRKLFGLIDLENKDGVRAGLCAFRESLRIFRDYSYQPEIWIVYALSGNETNPTKPITPEQFRNIEMVLTVLTSPKFTAHMGIARTVYHEVAVFKGELLNHKHLSMAIHGFAARAMKLRHPSLVWMLTSPVAKMVEIIDKALLSEAKRGEEMPDIFAEIRSLAEYEWFSRHSYLLSTSGMSTHVIAIEALTGQFA